MGRCRQIQKQSDRGCNAVKSEYWQKLAANNNDRRGSMVNQSKRRTLFSRVRSIYRESAEAAPNAYGYITIFTLIALIISTANYIISGGESFSNIYTVFVLGIGLTSAFYTTQYVVIHREAPSIFEMIRSKRFWLYSLGLLLVAIFLFAVMSLSYGSVMNGWGGFMSAIGFDPSAYGFPKIENIAFAVSFVMSLLFSRKLSLVLPEIVSGNPLSFFTSWKLMSINTFIFWGAMSVVLTPLFAMAIGYYYVRTPYLFAQILSQVMTYYLVATITIVFSGAGGVFWKEAVERAEAKEIKRKLQKA